MKKAVIFDVDGVIINSENYYKERRMKFFATKDIILSEADNHAFIGSNPKAMMRYLFPENDVAQKQLLNEYADFSKTQSFDTTLYLNPDIRSLLEQLQARSLRLAIASSGPLAHIQKMLEDNGLSDYFEQVISGEMFHESKPHPEIYNYSVSQLGLSVEECLVVEDSTHGIQAAKGAGLDVLALKQTDYQVDQHLANKRINSLLEVLDFV